VPRFTDSRRIRAASDVRSLPNALDAANATPSTPHPALR
jgi:hypothetical protein